MKDIYESLLKCEETNLNPTIIYNEGWMVRLLVEYSIQERINMGGFDFDEGCKWTSEALISSPFVDVKEYREGYTHADVVFGDFDVKYSNRGEITLNKPKTFGIIEAKMKSNLSKGTSNFKKYNQATRNVVCIAHNIKEIDCNTFFLVVAPKSMIKKYQIENQIDKKVILNQVEERFEVHGEKFKQEKNYSKIVENIKKMSIATISYEDWISMFADDQIREKLDEFYSRCLKWNRI